MFDQGTQGKTGKIVRKLFESLRFDHLDNHIAYVESLYSFRIRG